MKKSNKRQEKEYAQSSYGFGSVRNVSNNKKKEPLYRNPVYYDLQNKNFTEDIPFYLKQIEKFGQPVLELACGTGRITIPIAERGIEITGLDISEPMLSYAKTKAEEKGVDIEWVKADCRNFELSKKFNVILLPFNSICLLRDISSIESCLSRVKAHLKEDGRFIIDVFNPNLKLLTRDPSKRYPVFEFPDPGTGETVVVTENNIYDASTQINKVMWHYKIGNRAEEITEELDMRIFYPQELKEILQCNGFEIESVSGDYDESPFVSASPKQLVISHVRK